MLESGCWRPGIGTGGDRVLGPGEEVESGCWDRLGAVMLDGKAGRKVIGGY